MEWNQTFLDLRIHVVNRKGMTDRVALKEQLQCVEKKLLD